VFPGRGDKGGGVGMEQRLAAHQADSVDVPKELAQPLYIAFILLDVCKMRRCK